MSALKALEEEISRLEDELKLVNTAVTTEEAIKNLRQEIQQSDEPLLDMNKEMPYGPIAENGPCCTIC
jgi:hypothetical protein